MFKLDSENAVLETFRPKDRDLVALPPDLKLPVIVRDYLAWTHPAGGRVFVVFAVPGGAPTGIAFDTNGGAGPSVPQLCDWCHSSGQGTEVALLTARVHRAKRVGVHLCADLSCKAKVEDAANLAGRSVQAAIAPVVQRMGRFAADALKIDLSGAGR